MNTAKLHPAQLSTLLSSYEKDTEQILKLSSLLQYLFNFVHPKGSEQLSTLASHLLYYTCTTAQGLQTVGEESKNLLLLQTKPSYQPPSLVHRLVYIALKSAPNLINANLKQLTSKLNRVLPMTSQCNTSQLQLTSLLLTLTCSDLISRNLFNLTNFSLTPHHIFYPFYLTSVIDILTITFKTYEIIRKDNISETSSPLQHSNINPNLTSNFPCVVCQECISYPVTAAPCGHLGCWDCLTRCAAVGNACPLCKEEILPLLALRNL